MRILLSALCVGYFLAPFELSASAANTAEFRVAGFFPQGKRFRSIYGDSCADYQFCGTLALGCRFEVWGEVDYLTDSTSSDCYKTRVQIVNPSIGIRYVQPFGCNFDGYIGTGLSVPVVTLKNRSCCGNEDLTKTAWGSLSKLGVRYWFCDRFFLDAFVDYLYADAHYSRHQNVGGIKTGIGIGSKF